MKKLILIAAIGTLAFTHSASAASNNENAGVIGGALVGAAAGGPIGLIVGAAVGGHYGHVRERSASEERRADALDKTLTGAEAKLADARHDVTKLAGELARSQNEVSALAAEVEGLIQSQALLAGLKFDILFRTDETELGEAERQQIVILSEVLKRNPDVTIKLHGYADVRGADAHNDVLSKKRADAVAAFLSSLDIEDHRIRSYAYGERAATSREGDLDGHAKDRRVSVELDLGRGQPSSVASRD